MIYKYTEDNIRSLLHSVGTLEEAQLVRFFLPHVRLGQGRGRRQGVHRSLS